MADRRKLDEPIDRIQIPCLYRGHFHIRQTIETYHTNFREFT